MGNNSNLAARRGAKAIRRKAIVAQKRRTEAVAESMTAQAARAAILPIRHCLISRNLFDVGMGTLILARGSTIGPVFFTASLLDTFCRGVKDVMARPLEGEQFAAILDKLTEEQPMVSLDPICGRRLLRDLVEWSGSFGFRPHRDYPAVERLFGDVDPEHCDCDYEFGLAGKPLYVNGPYDSLPASRRIVTRLHEELGSDGFNYLIGSPATSG